MAIMYWAELKTGLIDFPYLPCLTATCMTLSGDSQKSLDSLNNSNKCESECLKLEKNCRLSCINTCALRHIITLGIAHLPLKQLSFWLFINLSTKSWTSPFSMNTYENL